MVARWSYHPTTWNRVASTARVGNFWARGLSGSTIFSRSNPPLSNTHTRTLNKYHCEADTIQVWGPAAPLRGEVEEGTPHQVNTVFDWLPVLQRAAPPGLMGSVKWCLIPSYWECSWWFESAWHQPHVLLLIIQQVTAERSQAGKSLICTVCFPLPPEANGPWAFTERMVAGAWGGGAPFVSIKQSLPLPLLAYLSLPLSLDRLHFSQRVYARQSFVNAQACLGAPASTQRQIFTPKGKYLWDVSIRGTEEKTVGRGKEKKEKNNGRWGVKRSLPVSRTSWERDKREIEKEWGRGRDGTALSHTEHTGMLRHRDPDPPEAASHHRSPDIHLQPTTPRQCRWEVRRRAAAPALHKLPLDGKVPGRNM